jgi:hypothetical protein
VCYSSEMGFLEGEEQENKDVKEDNSLSIFVL